MNEYRERVCGKKKALIWLLIIKGVLVLGVSQFQSRVALLFDTAGIELVDETGLGLAQEVRESYSVTRSHSIV